MVRPLPIRPPERVVEVSDSAKPRFEQAVAWLESDRHEARQKESVAIECDCKCAGASGAGLCHCCWHDYPTDVVVLSERERQVDDFFRWDKRIENSRAINPFENFTGHAGREDPHILAARLPAIVVMRSGSSSPLMICISADGRRFSAGFGWLQR